MHRHQVLLGALAGLLAFMLAACSPAAQSTPTPTSSPATQTPTATAQPPTATAQPAATATAIPAPSATPVTAGAQAVTPTPAATVNNVASSIQNFRLENLTVKVGTTVTWTNKDTAPHTATSSATPPLWDSGMLQKDASFSHTFTQAGTFPYVCKVHPSMTGTVTVQDATSSVATPTVTPASLPTATPTPAPTVAPSPVPSPLPAATATPVATSVPVATPTPASSGGAVMSNIQNFKLENLTVRVGTTVTWMNMDSAPHTATSSGSPREFQSGTLAQGQSYSHTFAKAGGFPYYCEFHAGMEGTVTVTS